jgi:hypothetical protein
MYPELFILTATKSISSLGYNGLLATAIALVGLEGKESLTLTFADCEINVQRTGKTGVVGGFAGEQFSAHYADESGQDVKATFLANVRRLSAIAQGNGMLH